MVYLYGVRRPQDAAPEDIFFHDKAFDAFTLIHLFSDTNNHHTALVNPLVLVSVDDKKVSSFRDYGKLMNAIKEGKMDSEYSSWRFVQNGACDLSECRLKKNI